MTFRSVHILLWLLLVTGCSENVRLANPETISSLIEVKRADSLTQRFSAPELQVRRYRTLFYGYNSVYYHLTALKPDAVTGTTLYRVDIDANYGSRLPREYKIAKSVSGLSYPLVNLKHETLRCQLFDMMISACLYRDRASIEIPRQELESGRENDLSFLIGSTDTTYESIDMPKNYIEGFLNAVKSVP